MYSRIRNVSKIDAGKSLLQCFACLRDSLVHPFILCLISAKNYFFIHWFLIYLFIYHLTGSSLSRAVLLLPSESCPWPNFSPVGCTVQFGRTILFLLKLFCCFCVCLHNNCGTNHTFRIGIAILVIFQFSLQS